VIIDFNKSLSLEIPTISCNSNLQWLVQQYNVLPLILDFSILLTIDVIWGCNIHVISSPILIKLFIIIWFWFDNYKIDLKPLLLQMIGLVITCAFYVISLKKENMIISVQHYKITKISIMILVLFY